MGIASLILGIVALLCGVIPLICGAFVGCWFAAIAFAAAGLVFGIIDTVAKTRKKLPANMGKAGIVLSAVTIVLLAVMVPYLITDDITVRPIDNNSVFVECEPAQSAAPAAVPDAAGQQQ